jgi:hypothetical protein
MGGKDPFSYQKAMTPDKRCRPDIEAIGNVQHKLTSMTAESSLSTHRIRQEPRPLVTGKVSMVRIAPPKTMIDRIPDGTPM